ncbi:MAG: hypothetical protein KJ587_10585 [Alphaproteobacteria bacterium]|nr:hypothetical protein [Alphaproteobacteria bacterium]
MAYDTTNIGDDIQSLAALQFMDRVDLLVNRDSIGDQDAFPNLPEASVTLLLNGWFMGRRSWPPAPCIRPIFTSSFRKGPRGIALHPSLRIGPDFH